MGTQEYLTLQLVRLMPPQEWSRTQNGLSFVFPKGGAGKHICGKDPQPLAPGDALVVDGAAGGKLCASNRSEMVFASFSVCLENLLPLFATNEIPLLQSVADGLKRPRFYPATSQLAVECHRLLKEVPPGFNLDHRSHLLRIAAAILTVELKNAHGLRAGYAGTEDRMIKLFERLSTTELLNLSVDELAAKFSCSRRHLNRLFHQHFGLSLTTLRMEMRLLKAVSLLRNPDAKVIYVAEECGFNHLGLFNTCFKRRFGHSPGQWRKQRLEAKGPSGHLAPVRPNCPLLINGLCPRANQSPRPIAVKPRASHNAPGRRLGLLAGIDPPNPDSGSTGPGLFIAIP